MIQDVLAVVLHTLGAIVAAAILALGFAFLIFLGDADARGRAVISAGFDRFAAIVVYLSWFAPLLWFGYSQLLLMAACAATVVLCFIYVASYRASVAAEHSAP